MAADERAAGAASVLPGDQRRSPSFWLRLVQRVLHNRRGQLGIAVIVLLVLAAAAAPLLARYGPLVQIQGAQLLKPSLTHFFGTDELSRDLFSRTLYGLRTSLLISLLSVLVGGATGSLIGLVSGYYEGVLDAVLMRFIDGLLAFPGILLGIAVIAAFGASSRNIGIVIAVFNVPVFARLARGAVLAEKHRDYVLAAQVIGASDGRVLFKHLLINVTSPLIVQGALAIAFAVLLEAGLEFLGLGARPPAPSLGSLLNNGQAFLATAPWYALLPGLVLALLLVALNFVADAVNEAMEA